MIEAMEEELLINLNLALLPTNYLSVFDHFGAGV